MRSPMTTRDDDEFEELPSVPRVRSGKNAAVAGKAPIDTSTYYKEWRTERRASRVPSVPSSRSSSPVRQRSKRRTRPLKRLSSEEDDVDVDDSAKAPHSRQSSHSGHNSQNSDSLEDAKDQGVSRNRTDDEVDPEAFDAGQDKLIAELENENDQDDSDDFDSSGDSRSRETSSRTNGSRLTMRQRALQGEKVELAYSRLESPKHKKKAPAVEDWTPDEEKELKKQQKARLRQMVHEKRNKEKRAATVDKVLRGVTSKRKKLTMANEVLAAKNGTRSTSSGVEQGFVRYLSGPGGAFVSVSNESALPLALCGGPRKAVYPRPCIRDPKTGKRIFTDV